MSTIYKSKTHQYRIIRFEFIGPFEKRFKVERMRLGWWRIPNWNYCINPNARHSSDWFGSHIIASEFIARAILADNLNFREENPIETIL
jgi:hypothetical protein